MNKFFRSLLSLTMAMVAIAMVGCGKDEVDSKTEPQPEPQPTSEPEPEPTPEPQLPVVAGATTPKIASVWFPPFKDWSPKNPKRIGYKVDVYAKVESKDPLKYKMESKDGKWSYVSTTGKFPEVYPTDDGEYTLTVTNTATGDKVEQSVKGLVKHGKLSAQSIEKQLQSGSLDRLFYFYFVPNVKIKCSGSVAGSNAPKTLSALASVASMYDTIDVKDATLEYDEWNRITSFEIELN